MACETVSCKRKKSISQPTADRASVESRDRRRFQNAETDTRSQRVLCMAHGWLGYFGRFSLACHHLGMGMGMGIGIGMA